MRQRPQFPRACQIAKGLELQVQEQSPGPLRPTIVDELEAGEREEHEDELKILRFRRDRLGRVIGFRLNIGLTRDLEFERERPPPARIR